MLTFGVLGAGHLGRIHLKLLRGLDGVEVAGFFDPDADARARAEAEFGLPAYASPAALIAASDAVVVVSSTAAHYENVREALRMGKPVFVEKPLAATAAQGHELLRLAEEAGVPVQVGHVERFNPAWLALRDMDLRPMFIEAHRLAAFTPRGTDVSVVYDLMIHDLDLILSVVDAPVARVSASGVAVISDSPDIANARVEFANGCVANLTASRISLKTMRRMRLFQKDAYITADFAERQAQVFRLTDAPPGGPDTNPDDAAFIEVNTGGRYAKRYIHFDAPPAPEVNAIAEELRAFRDAVLGRGEAPVGIWDGFRALELAQQVHDRLDRPVGAKPGA
jgi:predicted dehydrogenase